MTSLEEQASVLALVAATAELPGRYEWHRVADLIEAAGSARRIIQRDWTGFEPVFIDEAVALAARLDETRLEGAARLIQDLQAQSVRLYTVLDEDYPVNLRRIYNRPPFLFVRGLLKLEDERAIAVVGTRKASPEGLNQARMLARGLAKAGITVISGLALGIDAAAHESTLDRGGRTVAVLGTGILSKIYPPGNISLAQRILDNDGALVSQFWPTAPPTQYSFPMRNVVMSGISQGTVIIEASSHSGAKNQATHAIDHGKRLFLMRPLIAEQEWAAKLAAKSKLVTVIDRVEDIIDVLAAMTRPADQLKLA